MRRRPKAEVAAIALLAGLAGCAGDPTYYTLAPANGVALAGGPHAVEVETPSIAGFLDRDYIVSSTKDYELKLAGNRAWAEPLDQMVGRTLATDLATRLPGSRVYAENSAVTSATPDARVELDIGRFDKDDSGQAVLQATLVVRVELQGAALAATPQGAAPAATLPILLRETPPGADTRALVATLSRMLGEVADRAASALVRIPAPLPVPMPLPDGA